MKILILERSYDGEFYAYTESAEHHAIVNHNPYGGREMEDRVEFYDEDECRAKELLKPGQWTSFIISDFQI